MAPRREVQKTHHVSSSVLAESGSRRRLCKKHTHLRGGIFELPGFCRRFTSICKTRSERDRETDKVSRLMNAARKERSSRHEPRGPLLWAARGGYPARLASSDGWRARASGPENRHCKKSEGSLVLQLQGTQPE